MSLDALLVILLVWTVAGLLAAIAFGKVIRETGPDKEEGLPDSAGTLKYFRKSRTKSHAASKAAASAQDDDRRHASG